METLEVIIKKEAKQGIKGTLQLKDGSKTQFEVDPQGEFKQWGNTTTNMETTVPLMVELSQLVLS